MSVFNVGHTSAPNMAHVTTSTRQRSRDQTGEMIMVRPHHIDIHRFLQMWLREGRLMHKVVPAARVVGQRGSAKRYVSALTTASRCSRLVIVTSMAVTPRGNNESETLLGIVILPSLGLPVAPTVLTSGYWSARCSWTPILKVARDMQYHDLIMQNVLVADAYTHKQLAPRIIIIEPNAFGQCTESASPEQTRYCADPNIPHWSFAEILKTAD